MDKARKLLSLVTEVTDDSTRDNIVPPAEDIADQLLADLSKDLELVKAEVEAIPDEFTAKFKAVDEDEVDDKIDMDFTDGGNHGAYPDFVPKGEYWFGKSLSGEGKPATICHEFVEDIILTYVTGPGNYDFVHTAVADPIESIVRWIYRKVNPTKEESMVKATPRVEKWIEFWEKLHMRYTNDKKSR